MFKKTTQNLIFSQRIPFLFVWVFFAFQLLGGNLYAASQEERALERISAAPRPALRFKVGFEFQEVSGLCDWALHDPRVQAKSLFEMHDPGSPGVPPRVLWKVIIDTNDIEFVTSPFADNERELLGNCIKTILNSIEILKGLLDEKDSVTFDDWIIQINGICCRPDYKLVCDKSLKRSNNTRPLHFSPQVTIQHPLEWTIPLYYGLMGFDSPEMLNFSCAFPYHTILLEALRTGDSPQVRQVLSRQHNKLNGLVFLHALTLVELTPLEDDDEKALRETLHALQTYHQVDAKMKLSLMSRRPFSSMYKAIGAPADFSYAEYFKESMVAFNRRFTAVSAVPALLSKVNYGTQFLDPHTRAPISLTRLIPSFADPFFDANKEVITTLLEQGVLTTTMIRHMKGHESILDDYLHRSLELGDLQERYLIDVAAEDPIITEKVDYDVLSPPLFLGAEDSMGRFKAEILPEDQIFGEAIVEVRSIKSVGEWFLKRAGLDVSASRGRFLSNPERVEREALSLVDFLRSFTPKDFDDIYMGMLYALAKY